MKKAQEDKRVAAAGGPPRIRRVSSFITLAKTAQATRDYESQVAIILVRAALLLLAAYGERGSCVFSPAPFTCEMAAADFERLTAVVPPLLLAADAAHREAVPGALCEGPCGRREGEGGARCRQPRRSPRPGRVVRHRVRTPCFHLLRACVRSAPRR